MNRRLLMLMCMMAAVISHNVSAVQPNFVQDSLFNVDGQGSTIISTEYSDGLGRSIQSKLKLHDDTDRVSCTYYDSAGRPQYANNLCVFEGYYKTPANCSADIGVFAVLDDGSGTITETGVGSCHLPATAWAPFKVYFDLRGIMGTLAYIDARFNENNINNSLVLYLDEIKAGALYTTP